MQQQPRFVPIEAVDASQTSNEYRATDAGCSPGPARCGSLIPVLKAGAAAPAELEVGRVLFAALAAAYAAGARSLSGEGGENRFGAGTVAVILQPHLWLRDVRRDVADDARHVLVEHVRDNTCLLQPVQQQVGVEAVQGGVEAFQELVSQRQASAQMVSRSRRERQPRTELARAGSAK